MNNQFLKKHIFLALIIFVPAGVIAFTSGLKISYGAIGLAITIIAYIKFLTIDLAMHKSRIDKQNTEQ